MEDMEILTGHMYDKDMEIERLRAIVRVNGLRWGHTHAEIDAILEGHVDEQSAREGSK